MARARLCLWYGAGYDESREDQSGAGGAGGKDAGICQRQEVEGPNRHAPDQATHSHLRLCAWTASNTGTSSLRRFTICSTQQRTSNSKSSEHVTHTPSASPTPSKATSTKPERNFRLHSLPRRHAKRRLGHVRHPTALIDVKPPATELVRSDYLPTLQRRHLHPPSTHDIPKQRPYHTETTCQNRCPKYYSRHRHRQQPDERAERHRLGK